MQPLTKRDQIKKKWDKLIATSSIFGLTRLYTVKSPLVKIFWVLTSLAFLSLGLYLAYHSIKEYLDYRVVTNIQRVQTLSVIFPAVTLCGLDVSKTDIDFNDGFNTFRGEDLGPSDYEEFGDVYEEWTCIRFNGYVNDSVDLKTVNGTSFEDHALFIYMYNAPSSMLYAFVGPNRLNSYSSLSPILIFPGKVQNIYVTKSVDIKLPEPYNSCLNESADYHKENCVERCTESRVSAQYNCTLAGYYENKGSELCAYKDGASPDEDELAKAMAHCQLDCVEGCYSLTYSLTATEDVPTDDGSLDLTVIFSDLKYTEVTQIPKMTEFDLIGSIGGTLGIFIGFQILSVIEIFQFIFEIFLVLIKREEINTIFI